VPLTIFSPSKDAKYAVYGKSPSGSDWQEYHVMELATKKTLDDTIGGVKVSNVAMGGRRILLQPYPTPDQAKARAGINENHQVFFHKVGHPAVAGSSSSTRIRPIPSAFTSSKPR
jgi:prolyl oligopeptidase